MATILRPTDVEFARVGDLHIAYQVVGSGPIDLVFVPEGVTHIEALWENDHAAAFIHCLASFARVILFDKRGVGLSDPPAGGSPPTLEQWCDDLRGVVRAVSSNRFVLVGCGGGGPMCMFAAASDPGRTAALILINSFARLCHDEDYEFGAPAELLERYYSRLENTWGRANRFELWAPSLAGDPAVEAWYARYQRLASSPTAALAVQRFIGQVDVRALLPAIHVPTLVLHRTGNRFIPVAHSRYIAQRLLHAKYVELPGNDHLYFAGDTDCILGEVREFLTGVREPERADRVLATVLFTDIVDSTRIQSTVGDARWKRVLATHDEVVRRQVERFRGRLVKNTGDGFLAMFDGPARAIRCASAIRDAVRAIDLQIRAGLHTSEIELRGDDVSGIGVTIGARVSAIGTATQILVTSTVKDLVAGSTIAFVDRGLHELKGVPDRWQIYEVTSI